MASYLYNLPLTWESSPKDDVLDLVLGLQDGLLLIIFISDLRVISLRMRFLISCLASRMAFSLSYLPLTWDSSLWGWGYWSRVGLQDDLLLSIFIIYLWFESHLLRMRFFISCFVFRMTSCPQGDLFLSLFTSDLRVISLRMRILISCLASMMASSLYSFPLTWKSSP